MDVRVVGYLPLYDPPPGLEHRLADAEKLAEEIVQTLATFRLERLERYGTFRGRASLLEGEQSALLTSDQNDREFARIYFRHTHYRDWRFLRLEVDGRLPADATIEISFGAEPRAFPIAEFPEFFLPVAADALREMLVSIGVAANLAVPGAIDFGDGAVLHDGAMQSTVPIAISDLAFAAERSTRTGWPSLKTLEFRVVWEWVQAGGYQTRMGDTSISRAYNAFTYALVPPGNDDPTQLFWALMGVEALFSDGSAGVMQQVVAKSQLLLGAPTKYKKSFAHMYSVRSAFIHGGMAFPPQHYPYEALPEFTKFRSNVNDATALAQGMLVAALQEFAVRRWHSLEFELQLKGAAHKTGEQGT